MTKLQKKLLLFVAMIAILFLIPNFSNAAVEVSRNLFSNTGDMKFSFTGLELNEEHQYEFGITKFKQENVEKWFLITDYTQSTAIINISSTTKEHRDVVDTVDTGYITIKDKTDDSIVVEPHAVDLKIPYISVSNFTVIPNGKEFGTSENNSINISLRNASNSSAFYQFEKITDSNIISKFESIKSKNGDYSELKEDLKQNNPPTSNWSRWDYWNGYGTYSGGFGYPQKNITVPDEGLYYMWIYFSGSDGIKDVYGYILVDNLQPTISLESISLPKTAVVELNKKITLTPTFNPSNATNKIVTWSSSDESVASVNNAGEVTAKKIGSTIITVESQDGNKKATCTVTVKEEQKNNNGNDKNNNVNNTNIANNTSNTNRNNNNTNTNNVIKPSNRTNTNNSGDPTVSKNSLPNTGFNYRLIVLIVITLVVSIYVYIKYLSYKEVK